MFVCTSVPFFVTLGSIPVLFQYLPSPYILPWGNGIGVANPSATFDARAKTNQR